MRYMQDYSEQINKIKEELKSADAVLIGAGAGLSTSAGFTYTGKRFSDNFGDFERKYNFHDMYSGGFYPYPTLEEYWAYWSRYVFINRYQDPPKPVYSELLKLVQDKNYFVLTTNVDHCFLNAGFDKGRVFYTQGDYGLFQCSEPCHDKTYDNEDIIRRMVSEQNDMKIPSELIPLCPKCGKAMTMNLRADSTFVQDDGWYLASKRYETFIEKYKDGNIVLLELGVGNNTPSIIKYPFWRFAMRNEKAFYVSINYGEAFCPVEIGKRSICINEDIYKVIGRLLNAD